MTTLEALDSLTEASNVELAYREQARAAVERYNTAAAHDPRSSRAEQLWTLRKEALGQWKKAREDLAAAQARHGRAQTMRKAWGGR